MRANVGVMREKPTGRARERRIIGTRTRPRKVMTLKNAESITKNPFISKAEKQRMYSNLIERLSKSKK